MTAPTTLADVARIAAMDDPVLRNLWITQTYAELAQRLGTALATPTAPVNHTWCGFAVWASATAGQSIRREELSDVFVELLGLSPGVSRWERLLARATPHDVTAVFERSLDTVSERIAAGNVLVFAELAPLFVTLADHWSEDGADDATLDGALVAANGGRPLAPDVNRAFEWYRRARATTDPGTRAWAVCAGNVIAVAHEQRRLQADVVAALDAGPATVARLVAGHHHHRPAWWEHELEHLALAAWQELATVTMMVLRIPGAILHLGRPVPALPDGQHFPADLVELANAGDAATPYRRWDPTDGGHRAGERPDWGVMADRMTYIVRLFRSRQQDPGLAAAPFQPAQLAELAAGRRPGPPLLPKG